MTRCCSTSTAFCFAKASTDASAFFTLKATMMAPVEDAMSMSKEVTGPTPAWITLTPTASLASACTESLTASADPCTRATHTHKSPLYDYRYYARFWTFHHDGNQLASACSEKARDLERLHYLKSTFLSRGCSCGHLRRRVQTEIADSRS